jgi:hypothetical protein
MIGDLQYHNSHENFIFENRMKLWMKEADSIVIGETCEFFDNHSQILKGVVIRRINFYSFEVLHGEQIWYVPIEKFNQNRTL